jgi:AraC-like DNA-binding protein
MKSEFLQNLAQMPGVTLQVAHKQPIGSGSRDPRVLLNNDDFAQGVKPLDFFQQSRTYDTYDGQNKANEPDWYTIRFTEQMRFNAVEMTMGFPYRDGGWWTSLAVEIQTDQHQPWQPVNLMRITPDYDFTNHRGKRRPFESYLVTFDDVTASAVKLIGQPGGLAQFTSLARLAVYHRDCSSDLARFFTAPPTPYIYELISPATFADLSESLMKLTGLSISVEGLEYYLDESRYNRFWERIRANYYGQPDLWFIIGNAIGWDVLPQLQIETSKLYPATPNEPHVQVWFHHTLANAAAPIVIEGQTLGHLTTTSVVLKDQPFNHDWHMAWAQQYAIPWQEYQDAVARSPQMTMEQLEGAATLMGMIANNVATLAHHNLRFQDEIKELQLSAREQRKAIVQRAIDYMQQNLENPVTVNEVATTLALSPAYFCKLFKEETGRSPSSFLIDLRISRAKEFLAHTDMSIIEVCTSLGYTTSYFSRLFKRMTGYTPSDYARMMRSR